MRSSDLSLQAEFFRIEHGFSDTESINLDSLLLKLRILTLFRPLSKNFSGMCLKNKDNNMFILINSENPIGRQNFTIAHELYHLFLEDNFEFRVCELGSKEPSEKAANQFAASFLMPKKGIISLIPKDEKGKTISISTVLKISQYFSVSIEALSYRLENLRLIKRDRGEELRALSPNNLARQYGFDSRLYSSGNENLLIGDYGTLANKLLDEELISEGHFIELMNKISSDG